jgi:hypothetical protein
MTWLFRFAATAVPARVAAATPASAIAGSFLTKTSSTRLLFATPENLFGESEPQIATAAF